MALVLPVDAKALTIAYLKQHASVVALAGPRVGDRARWATWPQVSVVSFGGREIGAVVNQVHLHEAYLQVDCWGENLNAQETVQLLARTVWAALIEMPNTSHTRGVVTDVRTITPPHDFADELDRSRVQAEYGVIVRPHDL